MVAPGHLPGREAKKRAKSAVFGCFLAVFCSFAHVFDGVPGTVGWTLEHLPVKQKHAEPACNRLFLAFFRCFADVWLGGMGCLFVMFGVAVLGIVALCGPSAAVLKADLSC